MVTNFFNLFLRKKLIIQFFYYAVGDCLLKTYIKLRLPKLPVFKFRVSSSFPNPNDSAAYGLDGILSKTILYRIWAFS
jgi:hypothetical protein